MALRKVIKRTRARRQIKRKKVDRQLPPAGCEILKPRDVQLLYNISAPTRWRWERNGQLPPRDVYVGGVAKGWNPATLAAARRGPAAQPPNAARTDHTTQPNA
jgi:predicted DNA-binding transcriptional regulator AlpA